MHATGAPSDLEIPISDSDGEQINDEAEGALCYLADIFVCVLWSLCVGCGGILIVGGVPRIWVAAGAGVTYALYLVTCLKSPVYVYMCNIKALEEAEAALRGMHDAAPGIRLELVSYAANDQVKGPALNATHNAEESFSYGSCSDLSTPVFLESRSIVALHIPKPQIVMDHSTRAAYDAHKANFITTNDKDTFYDFAESIDLPNYQERMLVTSASAPWWIGKTPYVISTVLMLAPLYRLALYMTIHHVRHTIVKSLTNLEPVNDL
eukprot:TRINITY_DN25455_c0_g1_i1.p1 TRINITY_DN25455_c0_g1~~TRINITY_DN25455_c0_g1_i1.p1  ORF type:complete len:265 (+),score=46.72 TRINITY_DN25455_c0_g1_i1:70-864(+)